MTGKKGRPPGSKNIKTFNVEEIASRFELEPIEVLMMIANGDWHGLGYSAPTKITFTPQGLEVEEEHVNIAERSKAAVAAARYLYSPKQAVDPKTGDTAIKVVIEDYKSK